MIENETEILNLKDLLKRKCLRCSENEIEKIAQNLYNLGLFLVQLKVKQHSTSSKLDEDEQIKINPP